MKWCSSEELYARNLVYANGNTWWTLEAWVVGKKNKTVTIRHVVPDAYKNKWPGMSKEEWREMASAVEDALV